MNMLDDIKTLLSGTVYKNDMPDTPDNVTVLLNAPGLPTEYKMGTDKVAYERPGLQVRVRNTSYDDAVTNILAIKTILDNIVSQTINGTFYMTFMAESDIIRLGKDNRERTILAMNFEVNLKR